MAKERGRGNLRTRARERTKATLAWLRQRLLMLAGVASKGLHNVSVAIKVFINKVLLLSAMQPSEVPSNVSGLWPRVGGTRVLSQTVHREKAAAVDQVEVATTGKGEDGSQ